MPGAGVIMLRLLVFVALMHLGLLAATRFNMRNYDKDILQKFENSSEKIMATKISDYPDIMEFIEFMSTPSVERDQLILDSFKRPASRHEALEMCLKEIVLQQRFSEEKLKLLKDLSDNPDKHVDLLRRLGAIGFRTWKLYADSKIEYLWCNILLRWVSYCMEHPEDEGLYKALFKVIQDCALANWVPARGGFTAHSQNIPPFTEAEHLYIFTARNRLIDEKLFRSTWFKDSLTLCSFHYAKLVYLLVWGDGIHEGYAESLLKQPKRVYTWPSEYIALNDRLYGKLTYKFYTDGRKQISYLSPKTVDEAYESTVMMPDLLVASDITNSDDHFLEQSYVYKLHHVHVPTKRTKPSGSKNKRPPKKIVDSKNTESSSTPTLPLMPIPELNSVPTVEEESLSDKEEKKSENSDLSDNMSNEDSTEQLAGDEEDGEAYWKSQQEAYQLRKKIIQQQAKENAASKRLELLSRAKPQESKEKKGNVANFTSTDFCAAFPAAHELFVQNHNNICKAGAKRYRWVFDEKVIIKDEHMQFLCRLFGLSHEGKLSYKSMCRTFHQLEGPVAGQRNGFFQFSHRFEINKQQVSLPTASVKNEQKVLVTKGKSVHKEHKSSRFNWKQALELFEGAGFDPRFFIAIY